tara:strand:+ start:749 stop:1105 length:357 start_codon:yes stop_codon:yes gene_type:complete
MLFIIKTTISFLIFYIFLSIPVRNKPIFLHCHEYTNPATEIIYKNFSSLKDELNEEVIKPSASKIQTNIYKKVDSISTKLSGMKKEKDLIESVHKKMHKHHHHSHDENDREKLNNLFE